jgi:E3 ubiquitin-protein ligase BRE1
VVVKEECSQGEGSTNVKEEDKSNLGLATVKAEDADDDKSEVKKELGATAEGDVKKEDGDGSKDAQRAKDAKESEMVRDLRAQLKKAVTDQKEMKLLLDMYKGVSKDQRDKVQLMATEKKLRVELDEMRNQMKKMQDNKREDRKKLADEEAIRKIKQLEEQKYELQKQVQTQKQPPDGSWGYRPFVGSHVVNGLYSPFWKGKVILSFITGRRGSPQRNGSDWSGV